MLTTPLPPYRPHRETRPTRSPHESTAAPLELDQCPRNRAREDLPCRVQDPDLWFGERPAELELAKAFCRDCPVRLACLRGAVERREPWGVWGGEIFERGKIIARKRTPGRPRKTDRDVAA